MAYSSDPHQKRNFLPPQNQQENLVMRRAEDLCRAASKRGKACFSAFLSDRQQDLARAALEKLGCDFYRFDGGYPQALRQVLVLHSASMGRISRRPASISKISTSLESRL